MQDFKINKKIAIITLGLFTNIGGILQAYALQTVIKSLYPNYDVYLISNKNGYKYDTCPKFVKDNITEIIVESYSDIKDEYFDIIVLGSDQIWNYQWAFSQDWFMTYAKNFKTKIIVYGASFGFDTWNFNKNETVQINEMLHKYAAISLREKSGINLCKQFINENKLALVLDPTLLLDKSYYDILASESTISEETDIHIYILDEMAEKTNFIYETAKKLNYNICNYNTINDWLNNFKKCKCVITDSYHGCLFSLIYNKPFICFYNAERGNTRFDNLIELFNIKNRFIYSNNYNNINLNLLKEKPNCDFTTLKYNSIKYLKENI